MRAPEITESILEFAGARFRYAVTSEDVLWLCRAVEKECRDDGDDLDERRVAQVLVNCFCYEASLQHYTSLTTFTRAYAQPVNPRWMPSGDLFKRWHAVDPVKYSLRAAEARRDVHSARVDFGAECVSAVERALCAGPVDIPGNATDYAAPWLDASRKYVALTEAVVGENRLWTRAPEWRGYGVFQWQLCGSCHLRVAPSIDFIREISRQEAVAPA